ncbi:MAG: YkvA family protein [Pedobacter sp.]|nr:YkvA family protein [Pedobacter sp.]
MDKHRLKSSYQGFIRLAVPLLNNRNEMLNKLQQGFLKAIEHKTALSEVWNELQLFLSLVRDYSNKSYTAIPKRSVLAITAGLLYFISPLDIIPDFLLGLGFIDDAYVLSLVFQQVAKDLTEYQRWKTERAQVIC